MSHELLFNEIIYRIQYIYIYNSVIQLFVSPTLGKYRKNVKVYFVLDEDYKENIKLYSVDDAHYKQKSSR